MESFLTHLGNFAFFSGLECVLYFAILILAAVNYRRAPKAFMMLCVGCIVLLITAIGGSFLFFVLNTLGRNDIIDPDGLPLLSSILRTILMLARVAGLGLALSSSLVGRNI